MIKIIHLSDWHIQEELGEKKMIAKKLIDTVGDQIQKDDKVAVCICGDIVDKGSDGDILKKYENAKIIGNMLKEMLTSKTTDYRIMVVPGNHDIRLKPQPFFEKCMCRRERSYNFDGFRDFAAELTGSEDYNNYTKQSIISVEFADITWLLCNTAYHGNRRYGRIDAERIKKELADAKKPTVLLMHHTLFSSDENDSSTLRNGYEIVNSIKSNTIAILHGHTHGYKKVSLGDNCQVVGVGPFLKDIMDIGKQINVLEIASGGLHSVDNYVYHGDSAVSSYRLYHSEGNTTFVGSDLKGLVSKVRNAAKEHFRINNVLIRYQSDLTQMKRQIDTDFAEQLEAAQKWQEPQCPVDMWHNHGQIIQSRDSRKYIKDLLNNNPTSRRALITLIEQDQVQKSAGNTEYLPSFDIVQFSFPSDKRCELIISLYMRALEVGTFLPINLCELYLLADYLREANLSVSTVDISIFANRITEIPDIDTYKKAMIDMIDIGTLKALVDSQRNQEIIEMLIEKRDKKETPIRIEGLNALKACFFKPEYKKDLTGIISAISNLEKYRTDHSDCNDYGTNNKQLEKLKERVHAAYQKLINRLRGKA